MATSMADGATDPTMDRRKFVGVALAAGATGAAVAAGALTFIPLTKAIEPTPRFAYTGLKVLQGSQAPRGLPLIPVRVDADGLVQGVPDRLHWYRYCGRNNAPGLGEGFASDNVFRYHVSEQVLEQADADADLWWRDRLGHAARASDLVEPGKGAPALWRSEGVEATNPLTVLLIRVDPSRYDAAIAQEFFPDGILAVFNTCAHLCLIPTYRISRKGYGAGHWEHITCFGHGSWYDPAQIATYDFPPTG